MLAVDKQHLNAMHHAQQFGASTLDIDIQHVNVMHHAQQFGASTLLCLRISIPK